MDEEIETPAPFRRRCLYVHGFDGRGPRHYLPMLRNECLAWGRRESVTVDCGPSETARHVARFEACAQPMDKRLADGRPVATHFEVLRWDAHSRAVTPRGERIAPAALGVLLRMATAGMFDRWRRRFWQAFAVTLLPGLLVAFGALALLSLVAVRLVDMGLAALVWPTLFLLLAWGTTRQAAPGALAWIAAGMANEIRVASGADSLPKERRRALVVHIREALHDPEADEVIVVGHSVGARVAVSLLVEALQERDVPRPVQLLSLAQSTALVAGLPGATALRADLAFLAGTPELNWVDVTSPVDGANTPLADPVREVFGPDAAGGARTFSAWFRATRDPVAYAAARTDRYATHFLFLGVPERPDPDELDLFDMMLRPVPALARYDRMEETGPFYASRKDEPWTPSAARAKPARRNASASGRLA